MVKVCICYIQLSAPDPKDKNNCWTKPTSLEYRSGNEDCVTRRVRYSCTVIGR